MEQNIYGYPSHEEVQYNEDQLYNQYPGHMRDFHFAYPEGSTPMSELGMDSNWNSASPASASSPAESTQGLEPAQNWPGAVTPGIVDENTSGMDGPYNMPFHNYAPMFNNEFNNDFAVEPCVSYPHVANTHVGELPRASIRILFCNIHKRIAKIHTLHKPLQHHPRPFPPSTRSLSTKSNFQSHPTMTMFPNALLSSSPYSPTQFLLQWSLQWFS